MEIFGGRRNSMVKKSAIDRKKDSQSFDTVAYQYDEFRPEYPQELVDSILALSRLPEGGRILEVGCGTGKATRLFARRGYAIHCIEPGGNLAALAARNLHDYPLVSFEIARFEEWQERPGAFDLVISAQAFHWVPAEVGYAKAARSLKPGGSLALFWNMHPGFHGQIGVELDEIYQKITPELSGPENTIEETIQERSAEIIQSGCFGPLTVRRFPWSRTYQTREFIGLISTYSDHIRLPAQTRQRLSEGIAAIIDAQGGSIEANYLAVLFIAQTPS
jgi:SAM-dependent methyltransferase